jgi:hypothetical protein
VLALRRPRNLAAVVLPYISMASFAAFVGDPAVMILALAPSPLLGPLLARAVGAREETVAALVAGTLVLSFSLLLAGVPELAKPVNLGLAAFGIGVIFAGWLPRVRDLALPILDGARLAGLAAIVALAALTSYSLVDLRSFALAGAMLALGALSGALGARVFGGDPLPAAIGGGSRDFAVAAAVAMAAGLAGGGAVPLAYAALLVLATALLKVLVRRQA